MPKPRFIARMWVGLGLILAGCASYAAQRSTLPHAYLEQALQAVEARDAADAVATLNRAESAWLERNIPFTDPFFHFDPQPLRDMASARQAVQAGRWGDAAYYIRDALAHPSTLAPG